MAIVLFVFCAGLLFAAWRSRGGMRVTLVVFALLSAGTGAKMIADGYPYALHLQPHDTPPGIDAPTHP